VDGEGTPLVLVHGINAAASSLEMRRNFRPLGVYFRVYAPDLLGFGLSDRPAVFYTAQIYTDLLADFLREVVREPAHLLASSLSSAYAVRVAQEHPELARSLVLICPTGIERLSDPPTRGQRCTDSLFGVPGLGRQLFAALVSRPSVYYFLRTITYYQRDTITREVVNGYHLSGQRPGAQWAPRAFLGGRLNQNIAGAFAQLRQPVLLVWGKEARTTPLDTATAFLERNPRATLKVFPDAGLVPHDEQADTFNDYVHSWLKEQET
jgi:pimeloyl-ACP methyl ester carboxylesterase